MKKRKGNTLMRYSDKDWIFIGFDGDTVPDERKQWTEENAPGY